MLLLSNLSTIIAKRFDDEITQAINRAVVLTQLLRVEPGDSQVLQWVERIGGDAVPTTAVLASGTAVSTWNSDTKVPATLSYGSYHDAFSISGQARAAAAVTRNPMQLANLYAEELEESITRLASAIAKDCYSGDGSSDTILGLLHTAGGSPAGALQLTGTYANIARGSYARHASNVLTNSSVERDLSLDLMRELRRQIYVASGEKPDLWVCDPFTHEEYSKLLPPGPARQLKQEVTVRGQTIVLDGGYTALEFDGVPIVEDILCPAGNMIALNSRYARVKYLPDDPAAMTGSMGMIALHGTPESQFGAGNGRMQARIQELGKDGDAMKFSLFLYPQLQIKRCGAHGRIGDLRTS